MVALYSHTTNDITIHVIPIYLEEESKPEQHYFVWAYHISIRNDGAFPVQLIHRHWHITDALGHNTEVEGPGVVGDQPIIIKGELYRYTSGVHLHTASGIMSGRYEMQKVGTEERFFVTIPAFSLDSPHERISLQ